MHLLVYEKHHFESGSFHSYWAVLLRPAKEKQGQNFHKLCDSQCEKKIFFKKGSHWRDLPGNEVNKWGHEYIYPFPIIYPIISVRTVLS